MTYDLRRLRMHATIERIPKTRRYRVTSFRAALFFYADSRPPLSSKVR